MHQLTDAPDGDLAKPSPEESFFCFGRMATPVTFVYDGAEHRNDLHSCAYTPLKGLIVWQENADDWRALSNAYSRAVDALGPKQPPWAPDSPAITGATGLTGFTSTVVVNWRLLYALIDRARIEPVEVSERFWRRLVKLKDTQGRFFVNLRTERDPGGRATWLTRWEWLQAAWE